MKHYSIIKMMPKQRYQLKKLLTSQQLMKLLPSQNLKKIKMHFQLTQLPSSPFLQPQLLKLLLRLQKQLSSLLLPVKYSQLLLNFSVLSISNHLRIHHHTLPPLHHQEECEEQPRGQLLGILLALGSLREF